ncbi:hypothetical protein D3C73_894170 [compost metagenome]
MSKALQLIEAALKPMMKAGRKIDRIAMYVSVESSISDGKFIRTVYGPLQVRTNPHIKMGTSYLLEESGKKGRAFGWVTRRESRNETNKK